MMLFTRHNRRKQIKEHNQTVNNMTGIDGNFKLSVSNALDKYNILFQTVCHDKKVTAGYVYNYADSIAVGGEAKERLGQPALITVYSDDMAEYTLNGADDDQGTVMISGRKVVSQVITFCHELEHVRQFRESHESDGDPYYAKRNLVDIRNEKFYDKGNSRYWINRTEIEAEHQGIMEGYKQLCKMFPGNDAACEAAVCDYVKNRCFMETEKGLVHADYFVKPEQPYKSLKEIDAAFKIAEKANKPAFYDLDENFKLEKMQTDEFCRTVHIVKDNDSPWWVVKEKLTHSKSEAESVDVMYAVSLLLHPEDLQNYASLQKEADRLQFDAIFGEGMLQKLYEYDKAHGFDIQYELPVDKPVKVSVQKHREIPYDGPMLENDVQFPVKRGGLGE